MTSDVQACDVSGFFTNLPLPQNFLERREVLDLRLCMVEIGIVSVCGNTMCYLNYREAEVQVLKRT